jgi:L,D-transpeptidase catalytic domain
MEFIYYDGTKLFWLKDGKTAASFDASSGHGFDLSSDDFQKPSKQCVPWEGSIPEGTYRLDTWINSKVPDYTVKNGACDLNRQHGVQKVPKEKKMKPTGSGGSCIHLWGPNRVNLHPHDQQTRTACTPRRNGFYLHDSKKGGSSGCIEIGASFFKMLREWVKKNNPKNEKKQLLLLAVKYLGTTTRGNTKKRLRPRPSSSRISL